jgi:hypothetical protein
VQAGLQGADRRTRKLFYFNEFVAFSVVQEHDQPMFLGQLL